MPQKGKSIIKTPTQTNKSKFKELSCSACGDPKKISEYYQSWDNLHKTGKLPYCKQCIKDMCYDSNGNINVEKTKEMLKTINRPFLYDLFMTSVKDNMDTIGTYFKNIGMQQFRYSTWKDSIFEPDIEDKKPREVVFKKENTFVVTDEIFELFGAGYSNEEYSAMWRKYIFLKNNYKTKTNMHIEALVSYVRFKVKEEFAIAEGNVGEAEKWAKLANLAATAAKINPQQLSAADLSEGLSTISQISKAVEQVKDIISILPKFKQEPQDLADFTIWSYVNYERDLSGKPLCSYEEIYKFYDKMVKDNMTRYSFLKKDTTKQGRESALSFIESNEEINEEDSLEEAEEFGEELPN